MSLKARIRNIAKSKGVAAQVVLQNYMFERFLERVSLSEYKDKFILKGGMLIAAIVGLETRSTMDLDASIRAYPLNENNIKTVINQICSVYVNDDVIFKYIKVEPIREDDIYGGFRVFLEAVYETIITPLTVDFTSGDVITPQAVKYIFTGIFDKSKQIELWSYNIETILAEKVETILRRGVFNTRVRDFYDVYILSKTQKFDIDIYRQALNATVEHREMAEKVKNVEEIIASIESSDELRASWSKYQREYSYAKDISFEMIIEEIKKLI